MNNTPPRIRPTDIIICDDIRQEANDKFILIGVYPDGIAVPKLPTLIFLSLWVVFECSEDGKYEIELEIRGPKPDKKIGIGAEFENAQGKVSKAKFAATRIPVQLDEEGKVSIFFREKRAEDWKLLKTFPIEIKNIAPQDINSVF